MNQENQNNKLNNLFIHDLYDNVGRAKSTLNNILESIEERREEESITESIIFEITIEEIATTISHFTYSIHGLKAVKGEMKNQLTDLLNMPVPYNGEFTYQSYKRNKRNNIYTSIYEEYEKGISEIIDLDLNNKDIKESEHYNNVLDFLVKRIFIRGF